ncbi:AlpA family transcriptional regulator [Bradyrhizobium sp. URHD0069]|uniref:helix-turn-helix transcriptional regulator n=1 Tax=Bradyrhizobium sp. URHD0069 TaxID=1380355 RepID=UPI0009DC9C26|nr:AlpA family transcriptional regulator [Bradyrhizobium sp. URHD0069]
MRFLRVRKVVEMVGFSKTTLYARLKNGTFPKPVILGPQTVAFVESDVLDWMRRQVAQQNATATINSARDSQVGKAAPSCQGGSDV